MFSTSFNLLIEAAAPAPNPVQQPAQPTGITAQQIVDYFTQTKNVPVDSSRTLTYLAQNPNLVMQDARQVIGQVMAETTYSTEINKQDLGKTFLAAWRDYEHTLGQQPAVQAKEGEPQSQRAPSQQSSPLTDDYVKELKRQIKTLNSQIKKAKTAAEKNNAPQVVVNILNKATAAAQAAVNSSETGTDTSVKRS